MIGTWGRVSGMTWSSAWIGCGRSSGPMAMEDSDEIRRPGIEHPLHHGEHVGVHGDLLEGRRRGRAGCRRAWCAAPRRGCRPGRCPRSSLQLEERLVDLVDEVRFDGVREDGVAVLGDPRRGGLRGRGAGSPVAVWALGGVTSLNCRDDPARCRGVLRRQGSPGQRIGPVVGSRPTGPLAQSGSALA